MCVKIDYRFLSFVYIISVCIFREIKDLQQLIGYIKLPVSQQLVGGLFSLFIKVKVYHPKKSIDIS